MHLHLTSHLSVLSHDIQAVMVGQSRLSLAADFLFLPGEDLVSILPSLCVLLPLCCLFNSSRPRVSRFGSGRSPSVDQAVAPNVTCPGGPVCCTRDGIQWYCGKDNTLRSSKYWKRTFWKIRGVGNQSNYTIENLGIGSLYLVYPRI